MRLLSVVIAALALFIVLPLPANASEQIDAFDVAIDVRKDGDILVTETLTVTVEGDRIKRGIFRDLPRYYEKDGVNLPYQYDVKRVTRDGEKEPYDIERVGNAYRIRIGDADVYLDHRQHAYVIEYAVKNQIRYFAAYDEIYWNVTGNYWELPITEARATVTLPAGAVVTQTSAYTGKLGSRGREARHAVVDGVHQFETRRRLNKREGLTIAVGFEKGAVDPPSAADKGAEWWIKNRSAVILASALGLLSLFYSWAFIRVGRDPQKGPVFPQYEPPEGLSPAAVHRVYHRSFAGHQALIATLLDLAIKDRIKIDASSKKKTKLTLLEGGAHATPPAESLLRNIFNSRETLTLGDGYDASFTSAKSSFESTIGRIYGAAYFKWNSGYTVLAFILTAVAIALAIALSLIWTPWHTMGVIALIGAAIAFAYFIPAPTLRGQKTRTAIEGFRLYLKTAEKIYLDAVKVGSDAPPPMTVERYERFLPYAVALGVEEPWTRHFERLIPAEAAAYQPHWVYAGSRAPTLHGLNRSLVSSMSSGVTSALPQSSSSSGSGGGGFSGGGGGGGGGGGW